MPEAGCTFPRAAGTSVGALAAAFAATGADSGVFRDVLGRLDMRRQRFLARQQAAAR
jgi:NTE family protein